MVFGHAVIERLHVGEGVPVGDGDGVQAAVVAAGVPGAVLLGNQVQRGRPRRIGAANNTCFFQGKKLLFGYAVLFRVQPPGAGEHGGGATCVDVMNCAMEWLGRRGTGTQ